MSYKQQSPIPVVEGGTGDLILTMNGVLLGESTSAIGSTAAGTNGQLLIAATSAAPAFATLTSSGSTLTYTTGANTLNIDVTAPLNVAHGGTGDITLTNHGVLIGAGTAAITQLAAAATGTVLIGNTGADPSFSATPSVTSITIANAPTVSTDGTNKQYVDSLVAGLDFKNACYAATTATLNATYLNGVSGIGATLINAGSLAAFSVDGQSPVITSRILVKDQSSSFQNGIYTLTTVGSGAIAWILTRATDYDQTSEIQAGDVVPVEFGTTNATTLWLQTATVTVIGTDPITFSKFLGNGIVTLAGNSGTASGSTVTISGGNNITTTGSASTLSVAVTGTTQYNVQVGTASGNLASIAPSATSGVPLVSQGSSANPAFSTAVVAGGGTGNTTFTAYSVICAGTTSTGTFQNVVGVGTSGQVLTSNGPAALPTWQPAGSGGIATIDGDTGSITGTSTVSFVSVNGSQDSGKTITFLADNSSHTVYFSTSDTVGNTLIGAGNGAGLIAGGENNTGLGSAALNALTTGDQNVVVGADALITLITGSNNVVLGYNAASSYTSSESGNIIIGSGVTGTAAESNVTRIGSSQTTAYMAGIASVSVSNKNYVTINMSTGQLGSDTGPTTFTWSVITANQTAAVNNGYFCNKAGTLTLALPASSAVGDTIEVTNENTALGVQFTQASGQQILIGSTNTTSGATGTLTSSTVGNTLKIVCKVANTIWRATSEIGNWTPV